MKLLIHGSDSVSSRKTLTDKKNTFADAEKVVFDGSKITLSDLVTVFDSPSLFSSKKVIVIENFFLRALSKEKEEIMDFIKKSKSDHYLIFWEGKEIEKRVTGRYFNVEEIITCQPPLLLFRFLDSIGVNNAHTTITLYHSVLKERDAFFIYTMLVRQLRFLIMVLDKGPYGVKDISAWQAKKFSEQSKYFDLKNLINLYRQLLSLEYNYKSGNTPYEFRDLLDIYIAGI